jgi:hypothetical protein
MPPYFVIISFLILLSAAFSKLKWINEYEAKGVILIDGITLPKLIPNDKFAMIIGFFKKSDIGSLNANDEFRDGYLSFAVEGERNGNMDGLIFAQVIVNGMFYL